MDDGLLYFVLVLLIAGSAFFSGSETALSTFNRVRMKNAAEEGDKKAKQIMKLTENPSNFLSTIQIGVTLAGFLTSASASTTFAQLLTDAVITAVPSLPYGVINGISVVLITIIMSYFSLVLGELAPKSSRFPWL